jgi:uncharacterized repeat protein (TIGR03803 family)
MKPESMPATTERVANFTYRTKRIRPQSCACVLAFALTLAVFAAPSAQGQNYKEKVLYQFSSTTDGGTPYAGLISDAKGNLYGTATVGGKSTGCGGSSCGVVFRVTKAGKESVLWSFAGPKKDGATPYGGLLPDSAGNFYGTTYRGGKSDAGTVFTLPKSLKEKVIYNFKGSTDGGQPCSGLLPDSAGDLYGMADHGGASGFGAVFKVPKASKESVAYSFPQLSFPGLLPCGTPISDAKGNFYVTTYFGGTRNLGAVYQISKTGKGKVFYSFCSKSNCTDGAYPVGGLIMDAAGNLYGTTSAGGNTKCSVGCGVVFKLDKKGHQTVLYTFNGPDGETPYSVLIEDAKGNLYGTTTSGGNAGFGTVFKVTQGGKEAVLWNFMGGDDGVTPFAGLLSDAKGDLFGTTTQGGFTGSGVVFELIP